MGLPFYGRGVTSNNAYTYAEMVAGGTTTDGNYYNYLGSNANSMLRRAYEKNQSLIAPAVPGDYDGNGLVGAEDYDLRKSTFGAATGDLRADGIADGMIDSSDYTFWRDRMVEAAGAAVSVPEPGTFRTILLLVIAAIFFERPRGK